jgi:hypothetical protein
LRKPSCILPILDRDDLIVSGYTSQFVEPSKPHGPPSHL